MSSPYEDISSTVLRRMKEGGFDFAQIHVASFSILSKTPA